jgi:hypothetical protein
MTEHSSRSSIATPQRLSDNMIAVRDAVMLRECCLNLTQAVHVAQGGKRDSLPSVRSSLMAQHLLKRAIGSGGLPVWIIQHGRECLLAPIELLEGNIRNGILKTFGAQPQDLEGAVLWVKLAEWEKFRKACRRSGFGKAGARAAAPNRQLNHEQIIEMASEMRSQRKDLSIGSAAASIAHLLPPNRRTGKRRDARHIEKIISPLWGANGR